MFCQNCGNELKDNIRFCPHCGVKIENLNTPQRALSITNDNYSQVPSTMIDYQNVQEIISYLRNALRMEQFIYEQQTICDSLEDKRNNIINAPYIRRADEEGSNFSYNSVSYLDWKEKLLLPFFVIFGIIGFNIGRFIGHHFDSGLWGFLWSIVVVAISSFIGGVLGVVILCIVCDSIHNSNEKQELNNYITENRRKNENIDKMNEDDKAHRKEIIEQIDEELDIIYEKIADSIDVLQRYYAKDIINPSYRGLLPVMAILSYFEDERCFNLSGMGGAYNLYEEDLKWGRLYDRLDDIWDILDEIRDNQRRMYNTLCDCSSRIADAERTFSNAVTTISNTNARLLETADVIEYNTRITRENSAISTLLLGVDMVEKNKYM